MRTSITHLLAASALVFGLGLSACGGEQPADAAKTDAAKQGEAKQGEAKPDEAKPPEEAKPDEAKPDEAQPDEAAGSSGSPDDEAIAKTTIAPEHEAPDPDEPPAEAPAPTKKKTATKTAPASNIDGKALYLAKCKSCHGVDGKGKTKFAEKNEIEDLTKQKHSAAKIAKAITNGVADTKMKPFKDKLSKPEIDAVAAYVKTL